MSTIGQQRGSIQALANKLDHTKLKRAGVTDRRSEANHIIQMLHDAVQTLTFCERANIVLPPSMTKKQEPSW